MSTVAKAKHDDFKQVPAGTHPAWCFAVIDIGHQENTWQGDTKIAEQVILAFEIPTETVIIDGVERPMIMYSFYTLSLGKKANLRRDLEGWRGKVFTTEELNGFDLRNIIGKPCTLTVFHNENGKARIKGIGSQMKGIQMPTMHNSPLWFDLDAHGEGSEEYRQVPEWIREIIGKRVEPDTENQTPRGEVIDFDDDDIPF